jgi:ribosome maturation factor RimP
MQYLLFLNFAVAIDDRRERRPFPSSFGNIMEVTQQIRVIEEFVAGLVSSIPGFFLVETRIAQGNHVKVYVDADQGVAVDTLARINRTLYRQIEEKNLFPGGDFSLEVSSPGLDEPLKLHRQYLKNIGRYVEVIKTDGCRMEGKLTGVSETGITVEEERKRKPERKEKNTKTVLHSVPFTEIKTTKIQIKF